MCEKVQRYAKKYALDCKIQDIINLMENEKWTIERALSALGVKGKDREYIIKKLQEVIVLT